MRQTIPCDNCGTLITVYKNPVPTVDVVIAHPDKGIVLVERRFEPVGWALPGGFVDYGESVESAAVREAKEETGLTVELHELLGVYSNPDRDKRLHTITTVFTAVTKDAEKIKGGDDAANACFFPLADLPKVLAFDHAQIIEDFTKKFAARYGLKP